MKYGLDINVPRSRQIRVELWPIGSFGHPADTMPVPSSRADSTLLCGLLLK